MDAILLLLVPPERERKREIKPLTPFLRSEWPLVLSLTEIGAPTRHGGAGENYRPLPPHYASGTQGLLGVSCA